MTTCPCRYRSLLSSTVPSMSDDIRPVYEHVLSLLDASGASAILDLGCGRGEHLQMLAEHASEQTRLVGIDASEKAIDAARAATGGDPRFTFVVHDLTQGSPFEDGAFDRVLWKTFQGTGLFEGRVDAHVHTSTRFEPGRYGWERSRDFEGLVRRGMVTAEEYRAFHGALEELAARDQYFYAITMFSYVGAKADR